MNTLLAVSRPAATAGANMAATVGCPEAYRSPTTAWRRVDRGTGKAIPAGRHRTDKAASRTRRGRSQFKKMENA
jgi:hypothetical protein